MSLGDRMKMYEKQKEVRVEQGKPFVVRLDGHSFSKFTKGMQQPWDPKFISTMTLTAADLLIEFSATSAYVQSDEISLTFFPILSKTDEKEWEPYIFNGRYQKMSTVMAGFASARFNFHLKEVYSRGLQRFTTYGSIKYHPPMIKMLPSSTHPYAKYPLRDIFSEHEYEVNSPKHVAGKAHFDARIIEFPDDCELYNCILWRTRDCYKNAISKTAEKLLGTKTCFKKNTSEKLAMIKERDPKHMDSIHPGVLNGIFVKRVTKTKEGVTRSFTKYYCGPFMTNDNTIPKEQWYEFIKCKSLKEGQEGVFNKTP